MRQNPIDVVVVAFETFDTDTCVKHNNKIKS